MPTKKENKLTRESRIKEAVAYANLMEDGNLEAARFRCQSLLRQNRAMWPATTQRILATLVGMLAEKSMQD
jgi:hypothetical protein